ncbi:MAG: M23 family metallopeptidase [bacterium]|nr:M23 family metallopeptidase [bacterium]
MLKAVKILLPLLILSAIVFTLSLSQKPRSSIVKLSDVVERAVNKELETVRIVDTIKQGETISEILRNSGIASVHINPVIESFKKIYSVHRIKPGERYEISKDSLGNFISLSYAPSIEKEYLVSVNGRGDYISQEQKLNLTTKIKYLEGIIQTTAWDAILNSGESPDLLLLFTDIFQWDIDFFIDPRIGDRFKIVYEKIYVELSNEFVRYGKILTAQYISNGDSLVAFYFDNSPGDDGYYDLQGSSFQKTFLKSPLNYRRISSYFSSGRRHPILKIVRPHYGVDYAAPNGTPVSAAADGVVIDRGYDKSIGNFVKIRHKNARFVTLYGHLSRFETGTSKGERVKQKQIIGFVGQTGLATGPHLHYAFYDNGRPFNPLKIKNTSADPVLQENHDKFEQTKIEMLAHLKSGNYRNIPLIFFTASQVHFNLYTIPER